MSKKRFKWIKLSKNFFNTRAMKKIRTLAGGDTMTIIYLKLALSAIDDEGYIYFEGVEDDFFEELALEINEDSDNIKMALTVLINMRLVEMSSDMDRLLIPFVTENTGSESDSARRVRKHRETKALQCNTSVTACNTEKEIERDKEKKKSPPSAQAAPQGASGDSSYAPAVGKKKKVNKKEILPPTLEEVLQFFRDNYYKESVGTTAWHYYNDLDWHNSKGKHIKNWKSTMRNVWFKEEHKETEILPYVNM
jgi:predicted phage replisome organizer